jgi:hypothetical protein
MTMRFMMLMIRRGVREGSMVGKDFEVGLANLKAVAEN